MQVLNFGSLNIDLVYRVAHVVRPGETLAGTALERHAGGKGANQSAALALAGARVFHAGKIGDDGAWLVEQLARLGVDTRHVRRGDVPTGHAVIQVDTHGENAIVLCGGANRRIADDEVDATLAEFGPETVLLLQNEINGIPRLMRAAHARGLSIVFNPAPMDREVLAYPLELARTLIVNETEGAALVGAGEPADMLARLAARLPQAEIVLTLGSRGVLYHAGGHTLRVEACPVRVVDTTGAGDTFIGYFVARRMAGDAVERALRIASQAAAITVSRPGAMDAIPRLDEVAV